MKNNILMSICMIVKDEEAFIDNCLKSMEPIIDTGIVELVIVDTGSTDKTVEICKRYTDKVYFKRWNNNFSEARNYSISLAKGQYIFIQDADQAIAKESVDDFLFLINNEEFKNYNTIYLKLRNYMDSNLQKFSDLKFPLIFKNDGEFRYDGAVHNQPVFKEPVFYSDIQINHYGYIMDEEKKLEKFNRTATILKNELNKNPDNYYYRFQLARSFNSIGKYEEALREVREYMVLIKNKPLDKETLKYYRTAAQTYYINNCFEEAIEISNEVTLKYPYFIDCIYIRGLSFKSLGLYEESNTNLNNYIYVLENKLYLEDCDVEMFSVSSKENVITSIESNNKKIEFKGFVEDLKRNLKILLEEDIDSALNIIEEIKKQGLYNNVEDEEFFSITASVYFIKSDFKSAIEEIDRGLFINKNYFDLLYNKGYILEVAGEVEGAIRSYNKALNACDDAENEKFLKDKLIKLKNN